MVKNQTVNNYGTKRANISIVMNEGVMIRCKLVMANFLSVVGLLVKPSTNIAKPKGCIDASLSIS